MKNAKSISRLVSFVILASMLIQSLSGMAVFANVDVANNEDVALVDDTSYTLNSLHDMADLMVSLTYDEYSSDYSTVPVATQEIEIDVVNDYNEEMSEGKITFIPEDVVVRDGEEVIAPTVLTTNEGKLVYNITIPETAKYSITVEYYPVAGNGATIERILLIDNKIPFNEARYMNFTRVWRDIEDENYSMTERTFKKDVNGNEMRHVKEEAPEWRVQTLVDSQAFTSKPFEFYLTEGEHTIAFEAATEPIKIASIKLHGAEKLLTYEEYLEMHKDAPKVSADVAVNINAETPCRTSEQVIYAMNDRTSAVTKPQSTKATLLNTIGGNGGDKWKIAGQWIEWEFEVPETGMYKIIPRFKQTVNAGLFSSRSL